MEILLGLVVGLAAGALLAAVLYSSLKIRMEAEHTERLRHSSDQVRQETLRRSSATVKGQIGERFAPFVPGFGYQPADARFLGSPIDYVVFDGLAEGQVTGVAFVEIKVGAVPLTTFQKQVKAAIDEGRVYWRTVQLADADLPQ
jgi:predicted Holliday junction resolvase-like endonuclease